MTERRFPGTVRIDHQITTAFELTEEQIAEILGGELSAHLPEEQLGLEWTVEVDWDSGSGGNVRGAIIKFKSKKSEDLDV